MFEDDYRLDASLLIPSKQLRMSLMRHIDSLQPIIENAVREAIYELENNECYTEEFKKAVKDSVIKEVRFNVNMAVQKYCADYVNSKNEKINKKISDIIFHNL